MSEFAPVTQLVNERATIQPQVDVTCALSSTVCCCGKLGLRQGQGCTGLSHCLRGSTTTRQNGRQPEEHLVPEERRELAQDEITHQKLAQRRSYHRPRAEPKKLRQRLLLSSIGENPKKLQQWQKQYQQSKSGAAMLGGPPQIKLGAVTAKKECWSQ